MQWKTVEAFYNSWQEKESTCLSFLGDLSFWLMCCTMNTCTHRASCWAHAELSFTWLLRNKEKRTNSSTVCCIQRALRLYFDANSELGYCGTICEGSCFACPLLPSLVPEVSRSWWPGTELAWENGVPRK